MYLWERACPRWRWISQHQCWMLWPHRGQARSHRFFCWLLLHGSLQAGEQQSLKQVLFQSLRVGQLHPLQMLGK